jgi:epoxyqueuosine reductase
MDHRYIVNLLEKNGFRAVIIPASRVDEVKEEIRSLHREGALDDAFYKEWMPPRVDAKFPRSMRKPKSILLVSAPAYQQRVTFHFKGRAHEFIVPPTYGRAQAIRRRVREVVRSIDKKNRPRLVNAFPPLKLLAVRSGLALYGRNNVTYVPGFGSFQRLSGFYTDIEAPAGPWVEKRALPKCSKCRACLKACPTKAINDDRFLIRAERCLPRMNERKSKHPFPSWVKPEWHNAIVGCMICQRVCPYDREFPDKVEDGPSFTEQETEYILKGKYSGKKAASIRRKLDRVGLDMSVFPRNLKVLLDKQYPN